MTQRSPNVVAACLATALLSACAFAENWAGVEGASLRHNASRVDIQPEGLQKRWQRSFAPLPLGDQQGPNDPRSFSAGKGSQNLCLIEGKLCLIATENTGVANERTDYSAVVLDATSGRTLNWIGIKASEGNTRAYRWPHACVSASGDNLCGIVRTGWDPQTGIFFCSQGAYQSSYTAWRPLANLDSYQPGTIHQAMPAYRELARQHPGYQDAFGRTRSQLRTVFGPAEFHKELQPYSWGLSAQYAEPDVRASGQRVNYDPDFQTVFGRQGSSHYNTPSMFDFDAEGPLMVITKGAGWGHNSGGDAYVFNKHTGMKMTPEWPYPAGRKLLRPFSVGGAIVGNGRLFCAGPAQGQMGIARPEGRVPKLDQGLNVWAYDVRLADRRPDDGFDHEAETAILSPAFLHTFESRFTPEEDDLESFGQSYYETDGFYRNKAMLIDGKALWMAWKPSQAAGVELIRADDGGASTFDLGVAKGAKGVDLWPKISLSAPDGKKLIIYFTGWAQHRRRFRSDDVVADLKRMHGEDFDKLPQQEIDKTRRENRGAGMWEADLRPPRSPAELAIFDAASGQVRWTYNVSGNHASLPANEFWTYLDKTAMVVAGKWAYLGWVDLSGRDAALRLLAFDITSPTPEPIATLIPLGFASADNRKTALFDLIAVDGTLYALVTQSDRLWVRDPRWKAQHVVAIGPAR